MSALSPPAFPRNEAETPVTSDVRDLPPPGVLPSGRISPVGGCPQRRAQLVVRAHGGSSSGTRGARADERQSGWTLAPRSGQDRKNRALQRLWAGNRAGRAVPLGHGALAAG